MQYARDIENQAKQNIDYQILACAIIEKHRQWGQQDGYNHQD